MTTAATPTTTSTPGPALYVALELGVAKWKVVSSPGAGQRPREKNVVGGERGALAQELARAKERFGLPADAAVHCCYEAGREGVWLHRWLGALGVANLVVDSSRIQVNRRARRAKSDRLDAHQLLSSLLRYLVSGERRVWSVVHVPSDAAEAARQPGRELQALTQERTRIGNRVRGLLAAQGVRVRGVGGLAARLAQLRRWDGSALSAELQAQLQRELARLEQLEAQRRAVEGECRARLRGGQGVLVEQVQALQELRAIGPRSAWLFSGELFAWRQFRNRRQVGAVVGLTPTPYDSSRQRREQGISRAGNAAVRTMAVEIAWQWLRYQPQSVLSRWYQRRFGHGSSRLRRIGIIALARKLLIALWRYLESGTLPAGAQRKGPPATAPQPVAA